jgi:hypothetical protein
MAFPNFRKPLPEDRLSEKERNERIRILNQFSKKLKKEMRTSTFEDRIAIRQLLVFVGKRLELLDLENRHARGMAQYDSLLARTTKPVPQGLVGVTANALLDLGLHDRKKMIRRHEKATEPLIAEISLMAPEIDRLLDQRPSVDNENSILRPNSCLPEEPNRAEDAPSKSGSTNGKDPDSNPTRNARKNGANEVWLDPKNSRIVVDGKTYWRNHLADKIMQMKSLTERQRDAAVLSCGYRMGDESGSQMGDEAIGTLMGGKRKTVYGHRKAAESKMRQDPVMRLLLNNLKRKIEESEDHDD